MSTSACRTSIPRTLIQARTAFGNITAHIRIDVASKATINLQKPGEPLQQRSDLNPNLGSAKYGYSETFWYICFFRLLFVVLFHTCVTGAMILAKYLVSDVPEDLQYRIR